MKKLIALALLCAPLLFADDKAKESSKEESPAEVSLAKEHELQLDLISSQYREAVAIEEAARSKKEVAQLRLILLELQLRLALKVPESFRFDVPSKKFLPQPKPTNENSTP